MLKASKEAENLFFLLDHPIQDVPVAVKPEAAKRCEAGFTEKKHSVAYVKQKEEINRSLDLFTKTVSVELTEYHLLRIQKSGCE